MTRLPFALLSSMLCLWCNHSKGWVLQYMCSSCFMAALIACKVVHSLQVTGARSNRAAASLQSGVFPMHVYMRAWASAWACAHPHLCVRFHEFKHTFYNFLWPRSLWHEPSYMVHLMLMICCLGLQYAGCNLPVMCCNVMSFQREFVEDEGRNAKCIPPAL